MGKLIAITIISLTLLSLSGCATYRYPNYNSYYRNPNPSYYGGGYRNNGNGWGNGNRYYDDDGYRWRPHRHHDDDD